MRSSQFIADSELAAADGILTWDEETFRGHTVWGSDTVARGRAPGAGPYELKMVHVLLAERDREGLGLLLDRVLRIRGRLPLPMRHLRDALAS
jgi:hypothetical protein